ncbi:MAG: CRISPR-associated endoribonuclease Cas6 [Candidatus Promineifilaceae bacterium]
MLLSAVIHLQALKSGTISGGTGRAVHGLWFRQWSKTDPAVADALHAVGSDQPYTLSPLMDLPRAKKGVTAVSKGHEAWLRLTSLDPELTEHLLENWLPALPEQATLAGLPWAVSGVSLNAREHPWAGQDSYELVMDRSLAGGEQAAKWPLRLATPTTFRSGQDGHLPFPLPDTLVGSWLRRWQAYSPLPVQWDIRPLLREGLLVSRYRLQTVPVRHGKRLVIGCVGAITLRANKLDDETRALVSMLADYAFYCGSGHKTTQGMGQTRLEKER